MTEPVLQCVDHLVFACADLEQGTREISGRFGVEPVPGGQHPVYGTRNALVALGDACYLEIIAPDPHVLQRDEVRVFGIHELPAPRLITWAAHGTALEELTDAARREGVDLGTVSAGSRHRPDGAELTWTYTDPLAARNGGVLPFFIDWGDTQHPARGLPHECELLELTLYHPHAANVEQRLRVIGIELPVYPAEEPRIAARIRTPKGPVDL
ncbi:MAG TPA: VOC family protein [Woeseiaceae bacterium]